MKKLLILFLIVFSFAESIDKYNVYLNVLNNGNLKVKEVITYNFENNKKHGIFRFIPISRGEVKNIKASMDNHNVELVTAKKDNKLIIRLGSPDKLVTGIHTYTISYEMDKVVRNYNDKLNTIRFNAIGTEWKVPIKDVNVYLTLPNILKNATIKTFSGIYGSTSSTAKVKKLDNLHYKITIANLPPKNGLTVGIYFNKNLINAYKKPQVDNSWVWVFLILFTLGSYFYYKKHTIHLGPIAPEYYPPSDFDILESGVLIDEEFDDKDITAAILELAVRGYIKLEIKGKKGLFKKQKTILTKLESNKPLTPFLEKLYNALFENSDVLVLGEQDISVAMTLRENISSIKEQVFNFLVGEKYFYETPSKAKSKFFIVNLLLALPFVVFAGYQSFSVGDADIIGVSAFLIFDIVFILIAMFIIKSKIMKIVFILVPIIQLFLISSDVGIVSILSYPFPLIMLVLFPIIYFTKNIDVYTPKGAEKLKYLLGFKDFIQKVESNKIKLLLEKDPEYLDKVLPYAVLFGVSEHWFKLYDEFNYEPYWYYGNRDYFYYMDRTLYDSFETTKNYTESETSSSDFIGSDSAGGGAGGGGGDSW